MKKYRITVNGQQYDVTVEDMSSPAMKQPQNSGIQQAQKVDIPAVKSDLPKSTISAAGASFTVKAPMPGTVISVKVAIGQTIKKGDVLLILEAMKMENEICAEMDGMVLKIDVQAGSAVNTGDSLIELQ